MDVRKHGNGKEAGNSSAVAGDKRIPAFTQVTFRVNAPVRHGERIHIVGSIPALGSWNTLYGPALETSPATYPYWYSPTPVPLTTGMYTHLRFPV
mmetsp:Transcript_10477/g.13745  ORF Transcript_10477/g.13745 Transcript_10477/m.13745 type:complete len:95 (+) Transcript_10477:461-745(+)